MSDRERIDHFFGDPRFEGSEHPDAPAVEAYFCPECGCLTPNDPDVEPIQVCDVCGSFRHRDT